MIAQPLYAQSTNNGNIDFKINNEKLSSALHRLANETDMNFSYDAGDSLFNMKFNYSAFDKPPLVILDELLSNTNHTYKQVGNQIVIYKDKSGNDSSQQVEENSNDTHTSVTLIPLQNNIPDEPIIDTIYIQDTIVKMITDTIRITDTLFVEKEKPAKPATTKIKDIPVDYFNPMASRENGWSAGVFFAPIASDFSLASQSNTWSISNYSFGVEVSKIFNKLNISGGLKLTHFGEKFNNTYNVTDGGYFVTDTVDEYYTVSQTDTVWYYITDSTWKPVDSHEYSYNINNRIGYLEFTLSLSYDFYSSRKLRLYVEAGAQAGVLIYSTGLAIPDANEPSGIDFADLNFNSPSYSMLAGVGIKYRINEYLDFNSELYYFQNFNEVVIDYPLDKKISGAGLKLGLIYYF